VALEDVGAEIGEKKNLPPRHPENYRAPNRLAARILRRRLQHARDEAGQGREDGSARTGRPAGGTPEDNVVTKSIAAVLAVLGLASTAALPAAGEAPPRRPNILFILVDDYGVKDVGIEGSTLYETPNIDALARGGMRFTQGCAQ
jgi:hypothetical protein